MNGVHTGGPEGGWVEAVAEATRREIVRHDAELRDVAAALRISPQALQRRLEGSVPFDVSELEWLAGFLEIDLHIVFDQAALIQSRSPLPCRHFASGG